MGGASAWSSVQWRKINHLRVRRSYEPAAAPSLAFGRSFHSRFVVRRFQLSRSAARPLYRCTAHVVGRQVELPSSRLRTEERLCPSVCPVVARNGAASTERTAVRSRQVRRHRCVFRYLKIKVIWRSNTTVYCVKYRVSQKSLPWKVIRINKNGFKVWKVQGGPKLGTQYTVCYTVIPRLTKIIRSGITFVSRSVISRRFL